ncbi:hypothetical protein D1872_340050 [compost metagenome]
MAAGTGLRLTEILEIEIHEASDAALNHYAAWLTRIERWSPDERERQFAAAGEGRRFRLKL